jgi:mono/diheme cytochrome c family protein
MTMKTRNTIACLLVSAASLGFAAGALAQDAPAGDAAKGKQLWLGDGCSYCHGTVAQGGGGRAAGLRIAQQPIPFAAFLNQVRQPANEMPVYVEKVLSDKDVADIFAYIQSLPPAPDLNTIPILAN